MTIETPYMSLAETALYMTLSRRTIEELVASGALPSSLVTTKPGGRGRRIVNRKDADAYIGKRRQSGTTVGGAA